MVTADSLASSHPNPNIQVMSERDAPAAALCHVSKRLIKHRITGITFLVDTGADVSILPASARQKMLEPSGPPIQV